jgi:hypothetical protein
MKPSASKSKKNSKNSKIKKISININFKTDCWVSSESGKEKKGTSARSGKHSASTRKQPVPKTFKQPTLQFHKGANASDDVIIRKSGKSKFVVIGKQFVEDKTLVEDEDDKEDTVVDFQRDAGDATVYPQQFDGGKKGSRSEVEDKSGKRGENLGIDKEDENRNNESGVRVGADVDHCGVSVRVDVAKEAGLGGVVKSRDDAGGVMDGESVYDRVFGPPMCTNLMTAATRWLYAVHAQDATETECVKVVHDLQHWLTHPLLPDEAASLHADPHACFTNRERKDPS